METSLQNELDKVKSFLIDKKYARTASISSKLKIKSSNLNQIISILEGEGFLELKKVLYRGNRINKVFLLNGEESITEERKRFQREIDGLTIGKACFESPCFFCPHFDMCSEENAVNYLNCPKLNAWIEKPI